MSSRIKLFIPDPAFCRLGRPRVQLRVCVLQFVSFNGEVYIYICTYCTSDFDMHIYRAFNIFNIIGLLVSILISVG